MNRASELLSRRVALSRVLAAASGIGFGLASRPIFGAEAEFTPENVLGPFYPIEKPFDKDADLTRVRGRNGTAHGQIIYVSGRVLNIKGKPLKGARLELWQANSVGRYAHPGDENTAAALDPNFQGYAVQTTNRAGEFRFKTIKPGAYTAEPGWERPPHIHFDIRTSISRLVTQMFFPGEPLNDKDRLFTSLGDYSKLALATLQSAAKHVEVGATEYSWNVILYEK